MRRKGGESGQFSPHPNRPEGMIQDLEFMKPAPEKSEQALPMMMKMTSIFMCSRLNKQNKIVI